MSALWFDPTADIVKNDPPLKPVDPSRPIRRKPVLVDPAAAYAEISPYFGYQAPASDPA